MTKLKKRILTVTCAVALSLAVSMPASALTRTEKETSGGSGGSVTIVSRLISDVRQPTGSVYIAKYGVTSSISDSSTLITTFTITGLLTNDDSSHKISALNVTGNSATADYSQSGNNVVFYNHINSTTETNSIAFGHSFQECNGDV